MELRLSTHQAGGATIVEAGGEVELHNAPRLREVLKRICETPGPCCVVDMSGVSFIDSTGVGVLVGALKRAREHGGSLALACPQPRVRRVFEITGLLAALPIFDSLEAAQSACVSETPAAEPECTSAQAAAA
jgi:anti-sigma B factor antagonist